MMTVSPLLLAETGELPVSSFGTPMSGLMKGKRIRRTRIGWNRTEMPSLMFPDCQPLAGT